MKKIINLDKEYQSSTTEGNILSIETEDFIIQVKDKSLLDRIHRWSAYLLKKSSKPRSLKKVNCQFCGKKVYINQSHMCKG